MQIILYQAEMRPAEAERLGLVMASDVYRHARRMLGLRLVSLELFPFAPREAVEPSGGRDAIFEITMSAACSGAYSHVPLGPCTISFFTTTILVNGTPERHEIVDALDAPEGIFPIEIAGYARDLLDAVLEAAGFTVAATEEDDPRIRVLSPADFRVLLEELPPDDLLALARGGDLPAEHPYLRKVRGEAA